MIAAMDVETRARRIARLIEDRLGVGGDGLEAKLRRAGRALPRWVRREAETVVEAARFAGNPKLMKRIDPVRVERAAAKCESWLKSVDPAERRKDRILSFLAVNAVNLGLLTAGMIWLLMRMGHL